MDFNRPDQERLQVICDSLHMAYKNAVEGDVAEFGIAQGISFQHIAYTMNRCEQYTQRFKMPSKRLHGFDSFQGFPPATEPGDIDAPMCVHNVWAKPKTSPGEDAIKSTARQYLPKDQISLYPGFFSETLPSIPADVKFAFVHLDCDMYSSTRDVLEHLFRKGRFSDGCVLLFDDFIENRGSRRFGQRRAWEECRAKYCPAVTDLGFYGIAGWRFIVHTELQ